MRNISIQVDLELGEQYKEYCSSQNISMKEDLINYMRSVTKDFEKKKMSKREESLKLSRDLADELMTVVDEKDYHKLNSIIQQSFNRQSESDKHDFMNTEFKKVYTAYNMKLPLAFAVDPDIFKDSYEVDYFTFLASFITQLFSTMFKYND